MHVLDFLAILLDYTTMTTRLAFNTGKTRACATIDILDDNNLEATEDFYGCLTTSDEPLVIVRPNKTRVDINEDSTDGEQSQTCGDTIIIIVSCEHTDP